MYNKLLGYKPKATKADTYETWLYNFIVQKRGDKRNIDTVNFCYL